MLFSKAAAGRLVQPAHTRNRPSHPGASAPMKLCFLGTAESIHTYKWVSFFAQRNHDVRWFSLVPSNFKNLDGIRFRVIGGRGPQAVRLMRAAAEVRRAVREEPPDVLHAHYVGAYGLIGLAAGFHPFVATAWGSDVLFAGRLPVKRPLVRAVLQRADLITCDADHMADAIGTFGVPRDRIRLIYFGVDTERFCPGPRSLEIRERLGLGDSPTVISLRSFEPVYNIETLIRAIPIVRRTVPDVRFVLVGGGSEASMLQALAAALGVTEHARFVGRIPNHELPTLLRSTDVYVSTSLSDAGIAASTAEAMACGIPVVVTDSGENNKWIGDGVSGTLFPVRDPEALAREVSRLLTDRAASRSYGDAGRQVILARNDYAVEMEKMERLYAECVESG